MYFSRKNLTKSFLKGWIFEIVTKNKVINAELAISTLMATYADKIAKTQSSLFTAQSSSFDAEVQVSKLETNLANYKKRGRHDYGLMWKKRCS